MDTKTSIGNFPKNTSFYIASYMLSIRSGFKLDMKKLNISYLWIELHSSIIIICMVLDLPS